MIVLQDPAKPFTAFDLACSRADFFVGVHHLIAEALMVALCLIMDND